MPKAEQACFPVAQRIRQPADYQRVFSKRQRLFGRCFVLYYRRNNLNHPRIGIITSRRSAKLANRRNQARRIVREAFRLYPHSLGNTDIVIIGQKQIKLTNKQELRQCIDDLFKRLQTRLNKH